MTYMREQNIEGAHVTPMQLKEDNSLSLDSLAMYGGLPHHLTLMGSNGL